MYISIMIAKEQTDRKKKDERNSWAVQAKGLQVRKNPIGFSGRCLNIKGQVCAPPAEAQGVDSANSFFYKKGKAIYYRYSF